MRLLIDHDRRKNGKKTRQQILFMNCSNYKLLFAGEHRNDKRTKKIEEFISFLFTSIT